MGRTMGIDMGATSTLIYVKGKRIVINEPSVVAVDMGGERIRAVGDTAKMMLGKTPGDIKAIRPMQNGVVGDFDIAAGMLECYFRRILGASRLLFRPQVLITVPSCATGTERRYFHDTVMKAGAKNVGLVPETLAAALGCNLKIGEPRGKMIVNIGGGITEAAVISYGGIVLTNSVRIGGNDFDEAIMSYMKQGRGVIVGSACAELLKKNIGSLFEESEEKVMEVRGSNLRNRSMPVTVSIGSADLRGPLKAQAAKVVECIRATFERTPPELCSDIYDTGIILTGGSSMLRGLDKLIEQRTGVRTICASRTRDAAVYGLGRILDEGDRFGMVRQLDR